MFAFVCMKNNNCTQVLRGKKAKEMSTFNKTSVHFHNIDQLSCQ